MQIKIAEIDYRAISRESFSSLKHLLDSVEAYRTNKTSPFIGNPATRLGTAVHMFLQGMGHLVQVVPDIKTVLKNGSEGKYNDKTLQDEYVKEQLKINPEFHFITNPQYVICTTIYEKAERLGFLKQVEGDDVETAHIFEYNGVKLKGRLDWQRGNVLIRDAKTTEKPITPSYFDKIIQDSHYDMQAAMYIEAVFQASGVKPDYIITAVRTKAPHEIINYKLKQSTIDRGYRKLDYCTEKLKDLDKYDQEEKEILRKNQETELRYENELLEEEI